MKIAALIVLIGCALTANAARSRGAARRQLDVGHEAYDTVNPMGEKCTCYKPTSRGEPPAHIPDSEEELPSFELPTLPPPDYSEEVHTEKVFVAPPRVRIPTHETPEWKDACRTGDMAVLKDLWNTRRYATAMARRSGLSTRSKRY